MKRRWRSEPGGIRRRGRAVVAGGLAASMLAIGVFGTSTAAYGATSSHITLTEIDYYTPGLPQWAAFNWLFNEYDKTHPNITIDRQTGGRFGAPVEGARIGVDSLATGHRPR